MPMTDEEFLLGLLQACAACAPEPLYPAQFAREKNLDRDQLDGGLDELRRRQLVRLTDWVKGSGQGCALTEAGQRALRSRRLTAAPKPTPALQSAAEEPTGTFGRGEVVREAIFQPPTAWVTRVLLAANIGYFLFGALFAAWHGLSADDYLAGNGRSTNQVLIDLGALHPSLVFPPPQPGEPTPRPQYERLILFCFLHIGFIHLLMNMYFLGTLGSQIEALWGSARYAAIYVVAGIVSGCVVLLDAFLQGDGGLTAGSSGCLFGIFAAMIVWFVLNRQHLPPNVIQMWSRGLGINILLLVAINFFPGISWQGHLGGAIGGFLAALLLHVQRFHPIRAVRILALFAVPLVPLGFFLAVLWLAGRT